MKDSLREELIEYITKNQESFYRVAYSYVKESEASLDIIQGAIVKALEGYGSIREHKYLKTWFYRVLINESIDYVRKNKRVIAFKNEDMENLQGESSENENDFETYEMVTSLGEPYKSVLLLRFYEDLTLDEIARVTGCGKGSVKYRLQTGLDKLRKLMKEDLR